MPKAQLKKRRAAPAAKETTMINCKHIKSWCIALLLPVTHLSAQMGGGDPSTEIKEIATSIDRQLKEIDDLLRESGRSGQQRSKPRELLDKASENSLTVQDGIEKLIEKLQDMKNQGSPSSQPSESDQNSDSQPQDGQQQQGQQNPGQGEQQRRENETPDFVKQPQEGQQQGQEGQSQEQQGQKPGEQQQQDQQGDGNPKGGKENKNGGQNSVGNRAPKSETGPGSKGSGQGEWGDLQPYLNFLRNRGASPKVPAKYRKYYEAYLKQKSSGERKR